MTVTFLTTDISVECIKVENIDDAH